MYRLSAVQTSIAELRILDAVLWRYGKDQGITGGRSSKFGITS